MTVRIVTVTVGAQSEADHRRVLAVLAYLRG